MRKIRSLLLLNIIAATSFAQTEALSTQEALLRDLVAKNHIEPKALDDKFSANFFDAYLHQLDDEHLFFTTADLKTLEPFRTTLDDEWKSGNTQFFTTSVALYKTKMTAAKARINEICAKPFDFSVNDFYAVSADSVATTDKLLYNEWYHLLKWEVLQSLMNTASNQWQTKKVISKAEVLAKEPEARSRIKAKYLNLVNNYSGTDAEVTQALTTLYLNTFLTCFDPHSAFFDAQGKQDFQADLNTEGYFFGLTLGEDEKGEVFISKLFPGGPAWSCGVLNQGDVPVQLKWEGSNAVELSGLDGREVSALFDLHTKEKMQLTVRKANGQEQTVTLQKQKQENEANIVKSYVLSGKQNIGYITLPSFYTEWEDKTGSRCAEDVAKEIVKLKKDSIAGLILDLRFNGGGSLREAVELAGIFIDEGAVCQLKTKDPKIEVMKDMNRGTIYNGPLLLLVNGHSASASELLAASLQDYNRAIIAGTPTYGKATGQDILPLQSGGSSSTGFAKLTMMKLYRPTGKSAQQKGVQPDIFLPDVFGLEEQEAKEPFALPADTISAYKYFKPLPPLPIASLQQKSSSRVAANSKFKEGQSLLQTMAAYKQRPKISLKWEDAEKEVKGYTVKDKEALFQQPTSLYFVRSNTADQKLETALPYYTDLNSFWRKRLSADLYLEEAFQILSDFIQPH